MFAQVLLQGLDLTMMPAPTLRFKCLTFRPSLHRALDHPCMRRWSITTRTYPRLAAANWPA